MSNTMRSTFRPDDVTLLLKDITGLVEPLPAEIQRRASRRQAEVGVGVAAVGVQRRVAQALAG